MMQELFTTQVEIEGQPQTFQVGFAEEAYIFLATQHKTGIQKFTLKRQHDEWENAEKLEDALMQQAVEVLEKYLLRQH